MEARLRIGSSGVYNGSVNAPSASPTLRSGGSVPPSVAFLMLLVLAEFGTVLFLRLVFRNSHGG